MTPLLVLATSAKFAEENPKLLARIVKVHRQTTQWISDHPDKAAEMGAKEQGVSLDDAKKLANWSHFFDVLTPEDLRSLAKDQDFLFENGMMNKKVNTDKLVLPMATQP